MEKSIRRSILTVMLLTLVMVVVPRGVSAGTNTLELINQRSETVWAAYSTWDADQNTNFTKGWVVIKPGSSTIVTLDHYESYSEIINLYAKSNTYVWEGAFDPEVKETYHELYVRTGNHFQYWGMGGDRSNVKDWKLCKFFFVPKNENGNFVYTFAE